VYRKFLTTDIFFEGMAKALPLFLLDDEKKNKVAAQFFEWKPGPKTNH
jgi:hypothetical protein